MVWIFKAIGLNKWRYRRINSLWRRTNYVTHSGRFMLLYHALGDTLFLKKHFRHYCSLYFSIYINFFQDDLCKWARKYFLVAVFCNIFCLDIKILHLKNVLDTNYISRDIRKRSKLTLFIHAVVLTIIYAALSWSIKSTCF